MRTSGHRRITFVIGLGLVAACLTLPDSILAVQGTASVGLPPEARQFDFWLGRWSLTVSGPAAATSNITSFGIGGGLAILEDYNQPGYRGTSVSVYSPRDHAWNQIWLDSQGGYIDFTGGLENGKMIISGPLDEASAGRYRLIYYNITGQSIDQKYDLSSNGGQSWETNFAAHYRRTGPAVTTRFGKVTTAGPQLPSVARAFDYWLGTWTVIPSEGGAAGTSSVTAYGLGGGVGLLEDYVGADGSRRSSASFYDSLRRSWRMLSLDSDGTLLDLAGAVRSGTMTLEGDFTEPASGASKRARLTIARGGPGVLERLLETSDDDGVTWSPRRADRFFVEPVSKPADLVASKVKKKKVTLEWADTSAAEERFEIVSHSGADTTILATVGPNTTTATVKKLRRRTSYSFGVRACTGSECSEEAEIAIVTR